MTTITITQSTNGVPVAEFYDWSYDEPAVKTDDIPRFKFRAPNRGGVNAYKLTNGKEIEIRRDGELVFTGIIETIEPMRDAGRGDVIEAKGIHKGYHYLRRNFCHGYDFDEDGDPATTRDGVTVNNWQRFIFREPASDLDIYGNPFPVDGITVDEQMQQFIGTRLVYQHDFQDNSHLLASQVNAAVDMVSTGGGSGGGTSTKLLDSSGNGNHFDTDASPPTIPPPGATFTVVASPESKYGDGIEMGGGGNIFCGSSSFPTTGEFIVAGAFTLATPVSGNVHLLTVDAFPNETQPYNQSWAIGFESGVSSYWRYSSEHGAGVEGTGLAFSTTPATTGFHTYILKRTVESGTHHRVKIWVDNTLILNTTALKNDGGENGRLKLQGLHPGGTKMNHHELRIWYGTLPDEATVLKITDPSDPTYTGAAEGSEKGLWFFEEDDLVEPEPAETIADVDYPIVYRDGAGGDTRPALQRPRKGASTFHDVPLRIESIPVLNGDPNIRPGGDITSASILLVGERFASTNPTIQLCRNAGAIGAGNSLQNNTSRTYSTVSLSHAASYASSGLSAWTGTVNFSGSESVKNMLGYRIGFGGNDDDPATTKVYYIKIIATTASDTNLTAGTIEAYDPPTIANTRGSERKWVEMDFLGKTRLEAIESLRETTESDGGTNPSPHWDAYVDGDLAFHFVERRGSAITKEFSFGEGNLLSVSHEFYGDELAYQTVAYGVGSGTAQTRIVNTADYADGGLYDPDRDPTAGGTLYGDLPRILKFIDTNERSVLNLHRKARAFHRLHRDPQESFDVEVLAENIRYFGTGDGIEVEDIPTRTGGTIRVEKLSRSGRGGDREKLSLRLGTLMPPALVGNVQTFVRTEELSLGAKAQDGITGLSGNGTYFDKDTYGLFAFSVQDGSVVERVFLNITTVPWQATAKSTAVGGSHSHIISATATDESGVSSTFDGGDPTATALENVSLNTSTWTNHPYSFAPPSDADWMNVQVAGWNDSNDIHGWRARVAVTHGGGTSYYPSSSGKAAGVPSEGIGAFSVVAALNSIAVPLASLSGVSNVAVQLQSTGNDTASFSDEFAVSFFGARTHAYNIAATATAAASTISTSLNFGIYQYDGDSGDGTGDPVYGTGIALAVDPETDASNIPTTTQFNDKRAPHTFGSASGSQTLMVEVTGYLDADDSGFIASGEHRAFFTSGASSDNENGLAVVSVTPILKFRQSGD